MSRPSASGILIGMETNTVTEADILAAVIAPERPTLTPDVARSLLDLQFSDEQVRRMHALLEKNNAGTLTDLERLEMERYARVGNFLSLMQAKARLSLSAASDS
ncbi:MAG: hypothetical protein WD847_15240 [Pirellulales bacterium]